MTTNEFREAFFALAGDAEHIAITSHISPDDDSVGSVLSMHAILSKWFPNKSVRVIYTGQPVDRYSSFHTFEKIEWVDDVANHLDGIDMLIMLDGTKCSRFSKQPERLLTVPVTAVIDHHAGEPDPFTLLLCQPERNSTTELLYRIFFEGQDISKEEAELILLGIIGDTGGFSHIRPDQADVLVVGKRLLEAVGVSIDAFKSRYMGIPVRIIPLLQALVANTHYTEVEGWPSFQYSFIPRAVLQEGTYTDDDMSAASHIYIGQYLPKVQGYGWGFVVTPRADNTCRMSSRSLPASANVRMLHEAMGIGSGHDRASGGTFDFSEPSDCVARVLEFLRENKPQL